jgi:hypothetical protein
MQALEEEAPLRVDHVPKIQLMQEVAPDKDDHVPGGQVTHATIDAAPLVGLYFETTHGIQ